MMKKILITVIALSMVQMGNAQVGIGTTSPDPSAALEIASTDKGFVMPRMTTAQREAIANPTMGLQVFDTDTKTVWTYIDSAWSQSSNAGKFVDGASPEIAYYGNRVGIGIDNFNTTYKLYVQGKVSTASVNTAARINATYEGDGVSEATNALVGIARNNGTATLNYAVGTQGIIENPNTNGTIHNAVGSWPQISNSGNVTWGSAFVGELVNQGGTINTGYVSNQVLYNRPGSTMGQGSLASFYMSNEGSITGNGYGLWVGGVGTGTVGGNAYALYIATPFSNVTGNSYALYSENTSDSYIEGNLGVGTASPAQKVHINGVMRLEPQSSAPAGALGDIYVNTNGNIYFHNGTDWQQIQLVP